MHTREKIRVFIDDEGQEVHTDHFWLEELGKVEDDSGSEVELKRISSLMQSVYGFKGIYEFHEEQFMPLEFLSDDCLVSGTFRESNLGGRLAVKDRRFLCIDEQLSNLFLTETGLDLSGYWIEIESKEDQFDLIQAQVSRLVAKGKKDDLDHVLVEPTLFSQILLELGGKAFKYLSDHSDGPYLALGMFNPQYNFDIVCCPQGRLSNIQRFGSHRKFQFFDEDGREL